MPGSGSSFDRNDWELFNKMKASMDRIADQLERLNDNLEEMNSEE